FSSTSGMTSSATAVASFRIHPRYIMAEQRAFPAAPQGSGVCDARPDGTDATRPAPAGHTSHRPSPPPPAATAGRPPLLAILPPRRRPGGGVAPPRGARAPDPAG